MSDSALRLFAALLLPRPAREALVMWRASALDPSRELRFVAGDDLHVTLCFLGAVPAAAVAEVIDACSALSGSGAATLALGDPVWLPRRAPRVLAVKITDRDGRLGEIQSALSRGLAQRGLYRPEARPFLAHVTVARVRRVAARELVAPAPLAFTGDSVAVLHSRLGTGAARYEALARVGLG